MPLTSQDYATTAELKAYLRITDVVDDAQLARDLTAASRLVDQYANRFFGLDDPVAVRTYTYQGDRSDGRQSLLVNDVSSTVGLIVRFDEGDDGVFEKTLVLTTDFYFEPANADEAARPWTTIVLQAKGNATTFPRTPHAIQVTAKFGWAAVPVPIKEATLHHASRLFAVRNAPFGIAGSPDMGSEMRLLAQLNPDARSMVRPFRRHWAVA